MPTRRQTTPVSSDDARELFLKVAAALEPLGYFVGWHGSTIKGEGADVDVLVVPKRSSPDDIVSTLRKLGELEDVGYYTPVGFRGYFLTINDISIDLHVFGPIKWSLR